MVSVALDILRHLDVTALAFLVLILIFWNWIRKVHKDPNSKFRLEQFISDKEGHADKYSLGYILFMLIGAWALWYLTTNNKLTEWFLTTIIGAYVIGSIAKTAANVAERNKQREVDATAPSGTVQRTSQSETVEKTTVKRDSE